MVFSASASFGINDDAIRSLLDATPDGVIAVNDAGRIVLVNRHAEAMFGYVRAELIGESVERLLPTTRRAVHAAHRADYAAAPQVRAMGGTSIELFAVRKDGSEFPVEIALAPVTTAAGTLVIASVRDVADKRDMQSKLTLSDRMASVGMLAMGVAHEINNPLSVVLANLGYIEEVLAEVEPDPASEVRSALSDTREAAERIGIIVRDLRVFGRTGDAPSEAVDIAKVLESVLRIAGKAAQTTARVRTTFVPAPPVFADESRLVQIFLSLVSNAFQAMSADPDPSKEHELNLAVCPGPANTVEVIVADSGPGIAPDVRARIFDPFFTT
ncbi:MAG: PAS domain S-box protein, partial [Myxococcales bacterium]|nr:PAS domain S-box protein [Myxococcales bacterium]